MGGIGKRHTGIETKRKRNIRERGRYLIVKMSLQIGSDAEKAFHLPTPDQCFSPRPAVPEVDTAQDL